MSKDPRFNFYPDNWNGGTYGFTLEQKGAYLELLMLNFHRGPFTEQQALDKLAEATRGNTAVYTKLWNFLIPKFETDGKVFWSARLTKEMNKSRNHSKKQTERINKRWQKKSGNTAVLPDNGTGIGIGNGINKKESVSKLEIFESIFSDDRFITDLANTNKGKDLEIAWEQCWNYHSQKPSPPLELWEWKQKLVSWLTNFKNPINGTTKNRKESPADLAEALANRIMQDAASKQP